MSNLVARQSPRSGRATYLSRLCFQANESAPSNQSHLGYQMQHATIFKLVVLCALPLSCYASSALTSAHVVAVGTYGNGNVYVTLDQSLDQTGCPGPYIELPASSPSLKGVLSVAMVAKTTGAAVVVATDGCYSSNTATFTGARAGAFGLSNP